MEKLIFNKNGQWQLVKSWNKTQQEDIVFGWGEDGDPDCRDNTPPASGSLRSKMISHLQNRTKSRINPDTGEKEYRLFRTHANKDQRHLTGRSSWSTHPGFCGYWAAMHNRLLAEGSLDAKHGKARISAAWVPEKHIHSFLPPLQQKHNSEKEEGEAIVMPHDVKIDKVLKGRALNKILKDRRIVHPDNPNSAYYPDDILD